MFVGRQLRINVRVEGLECFGVGHAPVQTHAAIDGFDALARQMSGIILVFETIHRLHFAMHDGSNVNQNLAVPRAFGGQLSTLAVHRHEESLGRKGSSGRLIQLLQKSWRVRHIPRFQSGDSRIGVAHIGIAAFFGWVVEN